MSTLKENRLLFHYKPVSVDRFGTITEILPLQKRESIITSLLSTIPQNLPAETVIEEFLMPWMEEHHLPTADHLRRVANNSLYFGIMYGKMYPHNALSKKELMNLYLEALVHDIGKLAVPNTIFEEKHGLTPAQSTINKSHPYFTYFILSRIPSLQHLAHPSSLHHELWNGKGPKRYKGDQIPLSTQIVSLADSFDFIVNERPHFPAKPMSMAFDELRRNAGVLYSNKLIRVMDQIRFIFIKNPQIKKF